MSFEPAEPLAHEAECEKVKAARSCFKSLFSFCLFVCCCFQESDIPES